MADDLTERAKVAYAEAVRSADEQLRARASFRARSSVILSIAGLAASLFNFAGLTAGLMFFIGLTALALSIAAIGYLQLPIGWYTNPGLDVIARFVDATEADKKRAIEADQPPPRPDAHSELSLLIHFTEAHQENWTFNEETLRRMSTATAVSLASLGLMLVTWTVASVYGNESEDLPLQVQIVQLDQ